MNRRIDETPDRDITLAMLGDVDDGSIAGLANYHLWKMQLTSIRALPERDTGGNLPRAGR